MTGLWPPSALSPQVKAAHDSVEALRADRVTRLIERHGQLTKDQLRDLRVLSDLTEDLVLGGSFRHEYYGLVAG